MFLIRRANLYSVFQKVHDAGGLLLSVPSLDSINGVSPVEQAATPLLQRARWHFHHRYEHHNHVRSNHLLLRFAAVHHLVFCRHQQQRYGRRSPSTLTSVRNLSSVAEGVGLSTRCPGRPPPLSRTRADRERPAFRSTIVSSADAHVHFEQTHTHLEYHLELTTHVLLFQLCEGRSRRVVCSDGNSH